MARFAGALIIALAGALPAAAGTSPTVTPEVRAMARQLALAMASEPLASCSADVAPVRQFAAGGGAQLGQLGPDAPLQAFCSLGYVNGKPGGDCTGKHTINVGASKNGAKITTQLLGLDSAGNLLPNFATLVTNGTQVHMASRLSSANWKFQKKDKEWEVFAPLPMVKVVAELDGETAVAYCSNIPWLDVIEPSGGVATEDEGGGVKVVAAAPRTNPSSLQLLVDGVNLLSALQTESNVAVSPAQYGTACTAAAPCHATVGSVTATGVVIDIASTIDAFSSNTVLANIDGLSCGGHFVRVTTTKAIGSLKNPTSEACFVDDLTDRGAASIFTIAISTPTPGTSGYLTPTAVLGEVCSGTEIKEANVNGKVLPVTPFTFTPGNGETAGDKYTLQINTTLGRSDLASELYTITQKLDTFDPGSNRLVASAREIQGIRAYKRFVFATGEVAAVGVDPAALVINQQVLQDTVNQQFKKTLQANVQQALVPTQTTLNNAFVVGISAEGAQTLFNKLCSDPNPLAGNKTIGELFSEALTPQLEAYTEDNPFASGIHVPIPCDFTCDPHNVKLFVIDATIGTNVSCPITFSDGYFDVSMKLPDVSVSIGIKGHCRTEALGVCTSETTINTSTTVSVTGIHLDFRVSEANLLSFGTQDPSVPIFTPGAQVAAHIDGGVSFDCLGGEICNFGLGVIAFFTGFDELNNLDDLDIDFTTEIGATEPDAVKLKDLKVDEQNIENFGTKAKGVVSDVNITPAGISAGLQGTFAALVRDEDVPLSPGVALSPAGVPDFGSMRTQGALDALVGLSDDSINMMFASLTAAGSLKSGDAQGCFSTGAKIGSLLPANCNALTIGADLHLANAGARGYCHALKDPTQDCTTLDYTESADGLFDSTERGVCQGAKGGDCNLLIPDFAAWGACLVTPNFHLNAEQGIMFCAKGDVPPTMVFPDTGGPVGTVATSLRLNDLSVSLVIDRGANGAVNGSLATLPGCFSGTQTASDCTVFAACLDINLDFASRRVTCDAGLPTEKPGFQAGIPTIKILTRDVGVVCSGATSPAGDGDVLATSSDSTVTQPILINVEAFTPPICGAGLDLGGFVKCDDPQILALEANADPTLRDYLALTCALK